jgi:hypothetical protein
LTIELSDTNRYFENFKSNENLLKDRIDQLESELHQAEVIHGIQEILFL